MISHTHSTISEMKELVELRESDIDKSSVVRDKNELPLLSARKQRAFLVLVSRFRLIYRLSDAIEIT